MAYKYAIGKMARYIGRQDEIFSPSVLPKYEGNDWYQVLRTTLFDRYEQAQLAALLCTTRNPTGFVVIRVNDPGALSYADLTDDEIEVLRAVQERRTGRGENVDEDTI